MEASEALEKGVELFNQGRHREALKAFDHAAAQDDPRESVFRGRAIVLEKLNKIADALQDYKTAIMLEPDRWQNYMALAHLYVKISRFEDAIEQADLALKRIGTFNTKGLRHLLALKFSIAQRSAPSSTSECATGYISTEIHNHGGMTSTFNVVEEIMTNILECRQASFEILPVEIAATIFQVLVDEDSSLVVLLAQVCSRWRQIVFETPTLWNTLIISEGVNADEVETRLARSKGIIKQLQLRPMLNDFPSHKRIARLRQILNGLVWNQVESLRIVLSHNYGQPVCWLEQSSVERLRLRTLTFTGEGGGPRPGETSPDWFGLQSWNHHRVPTQIWLDLCLQTLTTITSLVLENIVLDWKRLEVFKVLKSLIIRRCYSNNTSISDVLPVLRNNPSIVEVVMDVDWATFSPPFPPYDESPVQLPFLRILEIGGAKAAPFFSFVKMPKLQTLRVFEVSPKNAYGNSSSDHLLSLLEDASASSLTELSLDRCGFSNTSIVSLLRRTSKLAALKITRYKGLVNSVLGALALTDPETNNLPRFCPLLQHLDVSFCEEMQPGWLRLLVGVRQPSTPTCNNVDVAESVDQPRIRVAPIGTLVMDASVLDHLHMLPPIDWLIENVDSVFIVKEDTNGAFVKRRVRSRLSGEI